MTKRESWAMFEALKSFNSRLEALAIEVTGLRAIVNIQSRQLAACHAERFAVNQHAPAACRIRYRGSIRAS